MTHVCSVYSPLCLIRCTRAVMAPLHDRQSEQVRTSANPRPSETRGVSFDIRLPQNKLEARLYSLIEYIHTHAAHGATVSLLHHYHPFYSSSYDCDAVSCCCCCRFFLQDSSRHIPHFLFFSFFCNYTSDTQMLARIKEKINISAFLFLYFIDIFVTRNYRFR